MDASVNVYRGLWCAIKCAGRCSSSLPSTAIAAEAAMAGGGCRGHVAIKRRKSATTHTGRTQIRHEGFPVSGNNSSLLGTLGLLFSFFCAQHAHNITTETLHVGKQTLGLLLLSLVCNNSDYGMCLCLAAVKWNAGMRKRHIIYAAPASIVTLNHFFFLFACLWQFADATTGQLVRVMRSGSTVAPVLPPHLLLLCKRTQFSLQEMSGKVYYYPIVQTSASVSEKHCNNAMVCNVPRRQLEINKKNDKGLKI